MPIQLIAEHGCLHTQNSDIVSRELKQFLYPEPNDHPILLKRYDEGDCDTIHWPNPNLEHLFTALYDAREMGVIPSDCIEAFLPDGSNIVF